MRYYIITQLLFFLFILSSEAQQIKYYYDDEKEKFVCKQGADFGPEKMRNIIAANTIKDGDSLACCYYRLGRYYMKKNPIEAIKFHEIGASLRETNKDKDSLLWMSYANLAIAHNQIEYYEKALYYVDKAIEVYPQFGDNAKAHILFCQAYFGIGEFEKSIEAGHIAVQLANVDATIGQAKEELFFALKEKCTPESLNKALKIAENIVILYESKDNTEDIARAYDHKGKVLHYLELYEKALGSYNIAQEKYQKIENTIDLAFTLNNKAFTYYELEKWQKAINLLKKALNLKQKHHKNAPYEFDYASTYENLGDNYVELHNIDTALYHYQLALINLTNNFRNQDISTNPVITDSIYIYNKPDLLRVLDLKAQAALKAKKIDLAHDTYQELDNWINEFYKDLSTNQSKLTWIARAHEMYSRAIQVALKKGDKAKAFQYAEKARAVLLWQSHSQQAALSLLDEEKREKYDNLLAQIRQTDYKYRDAIDKEKNKLKTELDALNRQFEQFENSLGESYAQRKYQPKDITLDGVQADILNETTALVEYHWSADNMLYIFTLTKNDIHVDTVRLSDDFEAQIPKFLMAINSSYNIVDSGYPIYQKAFAPVQTYLDEKHKNIQKIILLPDGKLNQIPFEALPTSPEKKSITHLIRNYTFNHLYSCDYSDSTYTNTIKTALLIAPEYGKADKLDSLSSIMKNKLPYPYLIALTGEVPKRDTVINQIPHADLIHIRAHAEQGTKNNGKIYLYGNTQLTQQDIQALDFKARHIVLDACETGTGKVSKGEGVLSLGWSFVYRGVPSVVMSFWKVNPSSTEILMENYHQQLKNGTPADEALRQAKLKLLDQRKTKKEQVLEFLGIRKSQMEAKYAEPNHWAAFIHTGNPPTKQFNQNTYKYFYILGGLLMLFFIVYLARKP